MSTNGDGLLGGGEDLADETTDTQRQQPDDDTTGVEGAEETIDEIAEETQPEPQPAPEEDLGGAIDPTDTQSPEEAAEDALEDVQESPAPEMPTEEETTAEEQVSEIVESAEQVTEETGIQEPEGFEDDISQVQRGRIEERQQQERLDEAQERGPRQFSELSQEQQTQVRESVESNLERELRQQTGQDVELSSEDYEIGAQLSGTRTVYSADLTEEGGARLTASAFQSGATADQISRLVPTTRESTPQPTREERLRQEVARLYEQQTGEEIDPSQIENPEQALDTLAGPEAPSVDVEFQPEQLPSELRRQGPSGQETVAPEPTQAEMQDARQAQTDFLASENPVAAREIEQSLEEQTGTDLSQEDVFYRREDGQLVGSLSEEGEETVEVQRTPLSDVPGVGGVLTTGTRIRRGIRDVTAGPREAFQEATPEADRLTDLIAAGAPVAVAEPTPIGEIGVGSAAVVGFGLAGAGTLSERVVGQSPEAQAREEIDVPQAPTEGGELQPGEPTVDELTPTETQVSELSPEEQAPTTQEISEPTADVFGPELDVTERSREMRRDIVETSGLLEERPQEDVPEITREDIDERFIEEPDQPGPSIREQQRREDIVAPDREFPTGEESVVGRGSIIDEARERQEQAEETFEPPADTVPGQTGTDVVGGIGERERAAQTPDVDVGVGVGEQPTQQQPQIPGLEPPFTTPEVNEEVAQTPTQVQVPQLTQPVETVLQEETAEVQQPQEFAYPTEVVNEEVYPEEATTPGPRSRGRRRPRIPLEFEGDEEYEGPGGLTPLAGEVITEFRNPLTGEIQETE